VHLVGIIYQNTSLKFHQTTRHHKFEDYLHGRAILVKLTVPRLSRNFPHFMKPESSLPWLKELVTCISDERDEASSLPPTPLLGEQFEYYSSFSSLFLQVESYRKPTCSSIPYVSHAPSILTSLISSPQ
jgi:hypothetical protein